MASADRTAVITGAGSGIGRAFALEAGRRGFQLALVGRRRDTLAATQADLTQPADSFIIVADVTTPEGRERVRAGLAGAWGQLDCLVNNAGIVAAGPLSGLGDGELGRLVATNLTAPIALTRELLPLLRSAATARVVNIGSLAGDIPMPLFAAYSATKFGLRGFSEALRLELESLGIGLTYAAPSGVRTAAAEAVAPVLAALGMRADDSPAAVAVRLWDAVEARRDTVYPAGRERWFVAVERLMPALVRRSFRRRLTAASRDNQIGAEAAVLHPASKQL
jgi:short-subunit dehydrogenase